ncbi:MAG: pyruvate dehydrogenase E2 component (dihydrolipoamide acetyltransferase) [Planctomycetota bacterium]|jgi:pyruvate dehydrogenase E2 component (dihydrolipoamide acetyltransferase)
MTLAQRAPSNRTISNHPPAALGTPAMIEFKLPDIGEGIAEGEIVKWLVAEGAVVEEHQAVVEVMTDKATVEVPAPAAGTVTKQLVAEGETVPVGEVIFHLDGQAKAVPAPSREPARVDPAPVSAPSGGVIEFKLPDIGEGIAEGEIVRWIVAEGATVAEHEAVVEVMTDKATVEVPSPAAGTVTRLLAAEGETVPVGQVIFELQASGATTLATKPAMATAAANTASVAPSTNGTAPANRPSGKVLAVPSARRVARELGVDLSSVTGSGRGGVIRRADVEDFSRDGLQTSAPAATTSTRPSSPMPMAAGEERRTPFRGVRRKIADAMVRSKYTAPHFTVVEEIDVTELVVLRAKAKAIGAEQGVKVTYMPFIMKAVALGLAKHPSLNGHLDEAAEEIVNPTWVNLGIATDTPNGLIVPVIPHVQAKGLLQLGSELGELAERTRNGKVKPDELRGSTFTITNAGNIGGTLATPIINFPDIAVLGVHRIVKRPGVVETPEGDKIEIRQYMNLSVSVDHRLADGADAARFLTTMRTLLETPGLLSL